MFENKKKYPPNGFRVCVDSREIDISGVAYSPLAEQAIVYNGFNDLILAIDRIFDENGYPQAFQEKRSFLEKEKTVSYHGIRQYQKKHLKFMKKKGSSLRRMCSWKADVMRAGKVMLVLAMRLI